jgi:hypothetical protein
MSKAFLLASDLSNANLSNANLSNSIIISMRRYDDLKINGQTHFINAVIYDYGNLFFDYIKKFTKKIPNKINNYEELEMKLKEKTTEENINKRKILLSNKIDS